MQQHLVRTYDQDKREPLEPLWQARHWSQAEVSGDIWFMLECDAPFTEGWAGRRRFVIPDFWEARTMYRRRLNDSPTLFAFVRAPVDLPGGHLFAALAEVSHVEDGDVLVLRFKSGLICISVGGEVRRERPASFGRQVFP